MPTVSHDSKLLGKPDVILPKYNTLIFINGCFWHGHENCKYSALPAQDRPFWGNKIAGNVERDRKQQASLINSGWRVITIWGCDLKPKERQKTLDELLNVLRHSD